MSAPSIRELATAVAFDVNRTVGGGHASIELLRRTFTSRGWLDPAGHGLLVAVSRLTPGTNILAYCVILGWRFQRAAGAAAALVAASIPASIVVFGLTAMLVRVDGYRAVRALLAVGVLAASVLVLASAWSLLRPFLGKASWGRLLVVVGVTIAFVAAGATPVRALLAAALTGAILPPGDVRR